YAPAKGTTLTCSGSETVSVNTTSGGTNDGTIIFYDVVGAASSNAYRGYLVNYNLGGGSVACCTTTTFTGAPVGTTDGIAFSNMQVAFNTASGVSSPTGAVLDSDL